MRERVGARKDVPQGRQWVYQVKLDGFRGTLYLEAGHGRFLSKTKKPLRRFDAVANTIAKELAVQDAILDGEVVVLVKAGRSSTH